MNFPLPQKHGKKVMAFGTFDLFHAGHEECLKQAKQLGDNLIVVIARDETVKNVKGEYPINNEKERLKSVKNSGYADKVILGNFSNKHQVIVKYKPDIIALGYDQFVFTQKLQTTFIQHNLNTEIVRMTPYLPHLYKTSILKNLHTKTEI
jgi:FAD synthetase